MPDREGWRRALRDGETKALVALVLAYCTELESLEASPGILFATDLDGSDNWLLRMFRHSLGVRSLPTMPATSLRKLRCIKIPAEQWSDDQDSASPESMSWWRSPETKASMLQGRKMRSEDWGRNAPQWKQAGEGENLDLALLLFYLPALEELSLPLPFSKKEVDFHSVLGGPRRRDCGRSTSRFETKAPSVGTTSPVPPQSPTCDGGARAKGSDVAISVWALQA